MKVIVLFDEEGRVGAMLHPKQGTNEVSEEEGGFLPGPGEHTALVEVPAELADLKSRDLHESVRVDTKGATPRLVAKAK